MGIIDAAFDAFSGTLADQWKDIVTVGEFDERTAVAPGVRKRSNEGYGYNQGQSNILSNGSIIYVPENTAAFIFSQSGIENVITEPGGYEYRNGQLSVFDKQSRDESGIVKTLFDQTAQRIGFSGMSADDKRISFVNLRELRGIKFGTRGPLAYNDLYYETDLEVYAYGLFSIQIVDPIAFVRNFLPANVGSYSFNDLESRSQLVAEFLHSFIVALNSLSTEYRISQLPSQAGKIADQIRSEGENAGTWKERFGIELCGVAIENIEFSDDSRELVHSYSEKKMSVRAYEGVSAQAGNMAAQQMIAEGVRENGLGDGGNMLFGLGLAGSLNPQNASQATEAAAPAKDVDARPAAPSVDDQVETLKKLKELVDMGILTPEEFTAKKKQLLGL
ncbi:SPFH domain-containing protein [Olsenella uli]|uniref:SPFH domain-containing protein n=1 Tax=Olsenella uli TaxID=133926 RepID=UPI003D7BF237